MDEAAPSLACVGLGSNLDDPRGQVSRALAALATLPGCRLIAQSALYRTPPMGPPGQPDYVNAVAMLETTLLPHALLDALQGIERQHARQRDVRWGPRTLDLDVLTFGGLRLHDARLTVPHPGIANRAFVLVPLAELAPALDIPGLGPVAGLLARIESHAIEKLPA